MSNVQLGGSALRISRVVLGCMFPSRLSEAEITRILHAAHDAGISTFDTAPLYDFHRSEEILGRALRDRHDRVQILTKAGLRWDDTHGRPLFSFIDRAGTPRVVRKDSRPDSLRAEIDDSCKRLGVERLDLLQIHHPDLDTPIAESIQALVDLQQQGKVRAFGVSNYSVAQLRCAVAAAGTTGLASLQSEHSLLQRWPEQGLLPACLEHGVGFLAYSPLAKGVLAARARRPQRASRGSRFDNPVVRLPIARAVQGALHDLASAYAATPAQIALAWLLAQPGESAVVVGASSVEQVLELARAAEITLRADEARLLGERFARVTPWLRLGDRVRSTPLLNKLNKLNKLSARVTRVLDRLA